MPFSPIKISTYLKGPIYISRGKNPKGHKCTIHSLENQNNDTKLENSMTKYKYLFWSQNKYGGIVFPKHFIRFKIDGSVIHYKYLAT